MNKIKLAAVTLTAAALLATLSATPAQAADQYIYVCNDAASAESIVATGGNGAHTTIPRNSCKSINDRGGNARVDVDPPGGVDIDSYQIFTDCYPYGCTRIWGPCHNGENGASNPDSSIVRASHYVTKTYACGAGTKPAVQG